MSRSDFSLSYQKSPIILTNGIAANVPGGMLPIISITQSQDFDGGILSGSSNLDLEDFLFDFYPMPGGSLMEVEVATYPFANQSVAANSVIQQPLKISLEMLAPVRTAGGYDQKLAIFQSLQSSLNQHITQGGTFTVATPAYLYTNCLLLSFRDASDGDRARPQWKWQWDFTQPLLTLEAAQAAQNSLMQKISTGSRVTPSTSGAVSYSGQQSAVGLPASGQGPSTVPAAQLLPGASVSGQPPQPTGG